MGKLAYSTVTPKLYDLAEVCRSNSEIASDLYTVHNVFRGLRDTNGNGVVTGLTEISTVLSKDIIDGKVIPKDGELYYRGIDVRDLVAGFMSENRFGFEETVYLLFFGKLPNREELNEFQDLLSGYRTLPKHFTRDVIMKASGKDIMNSMARSVLTLASYDKNASDLSLPNVLRQCIQLTANFSALAVYAYQAYRHYDLGKSLYIRRPDPRMSTAENFLRMLRPDGQFTPLEAKLVDVALVLHAEHGGGNNSTFTTHVVTSTGTDTYSAVAASLCSLKGPKHGGANIQVEMMFDYIKKQVNHWNRDTEIEDCLRNILHKEAYDRTGLIYGMGHAVYTISDPRAEIFKEIVRSLTKEKGREEEFDLYTRVAEISTRLIMEERNIVKGVSPNVDFYSGFAYSLLGLPKELYTPLFAIARIAGWSAHRMEALINSNKIIRPAYISVQDEVPYLPLAER